MDEDRLAAVEARLDIGQLPIRYAIGVDSRDLDLIASTFHPEVWMGKQWGQGPAAVTAFFDATLRRFYRTMHQICGHRVDLVDAGHARGMVYCRAEHEDRGRWIVQMIIYSDDYERYADGRWYFARRRHHHWYSSDVLERPAPDFQSWPGWEDSRPDLPHLFPTWQRFWEKGDPDHVAELTESP